MSTFVHRPCACGVEVIAVSDDEDDVRIAVASHNDLPRHREWRAVEDLRRRATRGPCICKGGEDVTNSPHTPQLGRSRRPTPGSREGVVSVAILNTPVKMGDRT